MLRRNNALFVHLLLLFRYCGLHGLKQESACTLSRKQRENTTRIISRKSLEMLASSIRLVTLLKAQMYYVSPPLVSTGRYR